MEPTGVEPATHMYFHRHSPKFVSKNNLQNPTTWWGEAPAEPSNQCSFGLRGSVALPPLRAPSRVGRVTPLSRSPAPPCLHLHGVNHTDPVVGAQSAFSEGRDHFEHLVRESADVQYAFAFLRLCRRIRLEVDAD